MTNSSSALSVYKRLLIVSRQYWGILALGVIGTLLLALIDAGFAWLIKPIVNEGFIARNHLFISTLPFLIIVIFILRGFANFASSYCTNRAARNVVMNFRGAIFNHLLRLPISFYDKNSSASLLATIIYNVEQVAQASSDALVTSLQEATLVVGLIVVMFVTDWKLSLFFVCVVPFIAWALKTSSQRLRRLSGGIQQSISEVTHVASEGIDAYKVIRIYDGEDYETKKFQGAIKRNQQRELKVVVTNSVGSSLVQLIIAVPIAVILFFATDPVLGVSAGSFASVVTSMIMILRPIRRLTMVNNYIQKGITGAASIFALLDEEPEKDIGKISLERVSGKIEYCDVSFQYANTHHPAINNLNFSIAPKQTIAIVGRSGSGKSTLINLLPRFYELQSGTIKIDGVDIRQYRLKDLRHQFSIVSQHTVLFNDTVAHNIAYGDAEKIDFEKLRQAAELAYATEFIDQLPKGFDTIIGEDGVLLSGGQRQRIAIARALYKNSPILILDEATASLDSHSERYIQEALANLMHRSTTFVIAHRLSTIEHADWILVLDQGRLVEQGTHQELLQKNGYYQELHRVQFQNKNSSSELSESYAEKN